MAVKFQYHKIKGGHEICTEKEVSINECVCGGGGGGGGKRWGTWNNDAMDKRSMISENMGL